MVILHNLAIHYMLFEYHSLYMFVKFTEKIMIRLLNCYE
jgi:hypothetical protein